MDGKWHLFPISISKFFLIMLRDNHVCGCYVASCTLPIKVLHCHVIARRFGFVVFHGFVIIWEQVRFLCKHLCGELVATAARCQGCKMNTLLRVLCSDTKDEQLERGSLFAGRIPLHFMTDANWQNTVTDLVKHLSSDYTGIHSWGSSGTLCSIQECFRIVLLCAVNLSLKIQKQ